MIGMLLLPHQVHVIPNVRKEYMCILYCVNMAWFYPPVLFYRWCRYLCLWPLNFTPKNSLVNIPTIVLVISKRQSKFSPRQSVYIYTSISLKTKFSPWQFFLHLKKNNQKLSLVPKNLIYTSISLKSLVAFKADDYRYMYIERGGGVLLFNAFTVKYIIFF